MPNINEFEIEKTLSGLKNNKAPEVQKNGLKAYSAYKGESLSRRELIKEKEVT